jgi:hypothetical protein
MNVKFLVAQKVKDIISMEQSKLYAINQFKQTINENALIYSGHEFIENISLESMNQLIIGTPFFLIDSLVNGVINYDEIEYRLPVKFHIIEQKLILNHPVYNTYIELYNERIRQFSIGQHFFYKTPMELSNLLKIDQVYAERLIDGKFQLWVMHDKKLKPTKKAEDQTLAYIIYDQYAVLNNGKWSKLKTKDDILDICFDKKNKVKEYMSYKRLNFKTNFEYATIEALKYYNSITD